MTGSSADEPQHTPAGLGPAGTAGVVLGLAGLAAVGALAFAVLRKPPAPPPAAIAKDRLLVEGREVFLERCVSCHGKSGRGDGPIAKGLTGPPVGDLTDDNWKHGDRPEQVEEVVAQGVPNTAMPGWGRTIGPEGVRAVSAYVYYLAGREVPGALRVAGRKPEG